MKIGKCEDSVAGIWSVGVRISWVCVSWRYVYLWDFNGNTTYKYVALGCDLSQKKKGMIFLVSVSCYRWLVHVVSVLRLVGIW